MKEKSAESLIPQPCVKRWNELENEQKTSYGATVRHCTSCDCKVYDLAGMSVAEIYALKDQLNKNGHRLCGKLKKSSKIASGAVALASLSLAACTPEPVPQHQPLNNDYALPAPDSRYAAESTDNSENAKNHEEPSKTGESEDWHNGIIIGMVAPRD